MKNKWFAYAASLLMTAMIVAASVFLPRVLLVRQEDRMLGVENNQGIRQYQSRVFPRASSTPSPSPSSAVQPTERPSGVSLEDLAVKIQLLENSGGSETYQREPIEGEMNMKQAVKSSIEQVEEYVKGAAMLPVAGFPNGYDVTATLNTIRGKTGATLDYWSITLVTSPDLTNANAGISLILDAETGVILSYKMSVNTQEAPDLSAGATFIASRLGLEGSVLEHSPKETENDSATWVCGDKSLFINLFCSNTGDTAAMSMNMSTRLLIR